MEVTFNIMMVNGLYIQEESGDGVYYFLRELNTYNLCKNPPKLLSDTDMEQWIKAAVETPDLILHDECTGFTFTTGDVIFKEVELIINTI